LRRRAAGRGKTFGAFVIQPQRLDAKYHSGAHFAVGCKPFCHRAPSKGVEGLSERGNGAKLEAFEEQTMKRHFFATAALALACSQAFALTAASAPAAAPAAAPVTQAAKAQTAASALVALNQAARNTALCDTCGVVQELRAEKRKGKGGAAGMVIGGVAGAAVGNQVGDGSGKKVATVAGAVGGAVVGNEVQKRVNKKKVWISTVKMKDGTIRTFEQTTPPDFSPGEVVKVTGDAVAKQ
jgi:outer membrane lipoprotein SlyB